MENRSHLVGMECRSILEAAVEKRSPLTLTVQSGNSWQVYKSQFLGLQKNRVILSQPVPDTADCHMEPGVGQQLAVAFKKGYNKCLFVTRVIGQDRLQLMDDGEYVPVLTVFCPEQIEKIQRRAFDRTDAPPGEPVEVTIQSAGQRKGSPLWKGTLTDLSAGGLGVSIPSPATAGLVENEQYNISFIPLPKQSPIQLSVRLRHITAGEDPGRSFVGFQIVGMEMSESGRNTLRRISRILGVYKRMNPQTRHDDCLRR